MTELGIPEARFVSVSGRRYCYRITGEGQAILLLHGLTDSSRVVWQDFVREFENQYTLVAIDLPGHGESESIRRGYTPTDQAKLVAAIIEMLKLSRPVLLGHSLGGIIAAKFAVLFPNRLSKLIICDSPLGAGFWRNLKLVNHVSVKGVTLVGVTLIPGLGRFVFKLRSQKTMRLALQNLRVFCDPSRITRETIEKLIQEKMRSTYDAVSQSLWHSVLFQNLYKDLNQISVPTLIIHGSHDSLVPVNWAQRAAARIPDSRLILIENAGHFPLIEKSKQFNQAVARFLSPVDTN